MAISRYERVFTLPEHLHSQGFPFEVEAGALLVDTLDGKKLAQLKMASHADKLVSSVEVRIQPLDEHGVPVGSVVSHTYTEVGARRGDSFGQRESIPLEDANVNSYRICTATITYADGTAASNETEEWAPLPEQEPLRATISDEELLRQYQLEYGDGCFYRAQQLGDLWRCVCGATNRTDEESCHKCGQSLERVINIDQQSLEGGKEARLEEARRQEEQRAEEERKAKEAAEKASAAAKKKLIVGIALAAVAVAVFAFVQGVIIPEQQRAAAYREAESLFESGDYANAAESFEALGEYKDSSDRAISASTSNALALIYAGEYSEALGVLKALADAPDQASEVVQAYLSAVDELANEGKYDEAYELADKMSSYSMKDKTIFSESTQRKHDYAKAEGDSLKSKGEYEKAILWYQKAGEDELVSGCKYEYAKANFDNENETTYKYLQELKRADYKDSASLYESLYTWQVDMTGFEVEERNNGYGANVYMRYKISGGTPGEELVFHVDFSETGTAASDGRTRSYDDDGDIKLTIAKYKEDLSKYDEDGYTRHSIYVGDLRPNLYTSLSATYTITCNGQTLSDTIILR